MNLVTTIDQVREVVGNAIRKENTFEVLKPFLNGVEETLIHDLIGQDQLDELASSPTGITAELLSLVTKAIIWNGYLDAWYHTFYQLGQTGISRQRPKDTEGLFRYQEENIQKDILRKADFAIERLMEFLVQHVDEFPKWKESAEHQTGHVYIIATPAALQVSLPEVTKSYRMYLVLRGYMARVERSTAKVTMGAALYSALTGKLKLGTQLDANYRRLQELSAEYVAPATLLEAMPFIRVQFTPNGVRVMNVMNNLQDETAIVDEQTKWLMDLLRERSENARAELRQFLNDTASPAVFPEYFNSGLYVAPGSREWMMPDNCGKKHFRM
ncbi:DUF6712 family protein [Dyadobacter diqingensis]|uniref:DUF6712 family protein n=1 Tax=Dyadobacter diqingensis TaxID=2938121 RepID=UPI0020C2DA4D|nr:DUF6712 family protein [Dyadobacter diqingensis]